MSRLVRLAWRAYRRGRNRYRMLIVAMALASGMLTVMLGATIGAQRSLRAKTARYFSGDLIVLGYHQGDGSSRIDDLDRVLAAATGALPASGIVTTTLRSVYYRSGEIELIASGYSIRQRRVVGVEWDRERPTLENFAFIEGGVPDGADRDALLLSSAAARELRLRVDDVVTLSITSDRGRISSDRFRVAGIYHEESFFGFVSYVHRAALNRLREVAPDTVNEVGVHLTDARRRETHAAAALVEALAARGLASFGLIETRGAYEREAYVARDRREYGVVTLSAQLQEITDLVNALGAVAGAVVLLFLAIVSVGVSNTWTMVVWDRTREIGTLRAIGVSRRGVALLLLLESVFLALHGAILGLVVGGGVTVLLRSVRLPSSAITELLLQRQRVAAVLPLWSIAAITLLVIGAGLIGAARGALRASRIPAAEAMQARV